MGLSIIEFHLFAGTGIRAFLSLANACEFIFFFLFSWRGCFRVSVCPWTANKKVIKDEGSFGHGSDSIGYLKLQRLGQIFFRHSGILIFCTRSAIKFRNKDLTYWTICFWDLKIKFRDLNVLFMWSYVIEVLLGSIRCF